MIRIDDKPYSFKYKIEDISLNDYLTLVDILSEDEYLTYIDKNGKEQKKKDPVPKSDRSEEFLMNLYRKIIKYLSNIPLKYLNEDALILELIEKISPVFELASKIMSEVSKDIEEGKEILTDLTDEVDSKFINSKNKKYSWTSPETWAFNKWVTLEMLLRGEHKKLEDGTTELVTPGNRCVLPLLYGDWSDDLKDYENKFELFNKKLSFSITYSNYIRILAVINEIKEKHPFIYNNNGSYSATNPHAQKHSQDFGWLDVMGRLADKGVFGTYLELKKAPLLHVLEYLNCSTSRDSAEYEDSKIPHK